MALSSDEFDAIVPAPGTWAVTVAFRRVVDRLGPDAPITISELQDKVLGESDRVTDELFDVLGDEV